ncbi:MAG: chemotaxis-specific protein-glutamate methyltransferase CheB [Magnetococcales bacterium]|nr:chemotaxis-specific protein-glutamate methyltransferase CheB [Magnetococcales bacterium]
MRRIRIVIADDSPFARELLRHLLEEVEGIEVVGEATNGQQAVALVQQLHPNLVTMDLEMPVMGGLEAISEIMCTKAVPILVVSSLTDAPTALEALRLGALDVIEKPEIGAASAEQLIAKVQLLAGVAVVTRLRPGRMSHTAATRMPESKHSWSSLHAYPRLFAIASSMGGPQALARILPDLPEDFCCPILIAQHISDGFAHGIVEWLSGLCRLPVRLAVDGVLLEPGVIHVSPSEAHLTVTSASRIALLPRSAQDIYHPSCDHLLLSVAHWFGARAIGIILTGMGHDGAAGMLRIRERGGITLAQDEASSMIFGMNQAAIRAGAIQRILPLEAMAGEMIRLSRSGGPVFTSGGQP